MQYLITLLIAFTLPLAAQSSPDTIILTPRTAIISQGPLKLERKGHLPENLGFWTDKESTASWTLDLKVGGMYAPSLIFSCADEMAGSEVALLNGTREIGRFTVAATGGFKNFRVIDLPPSAFPEGVSTLTLRPIHKPGVAVMDLRLITLTATPKP